MARRITVHLICNAHIDPVWLWPWTAGLDEVINTCSSVCDLLDRNPDVIFTRGEAWVYEQIEKIDPALFSRIRKHIRAGQWEVVGGWYLQPDCNLPHVEGFRKQIELGRGYFRSRFGIFPKIGYNVDSFGHAPAIPEVMSEAGQRYYVMMRPQEHELNLPSRLFHWRGRTEGPSVLTFRVAGAYQTSKEMTLEHVRKSLTGLPEGIEDTMCFIGVGDHGGGPTQAIIDWCRTNRDSIPGARLEFSSPSRFFRAVAASRARVPTVTGELQFHAIGCYSVHRAAKTGVRRAEHALAQAEEALRIEPSLKRRYSEAMRSAWSWLCFNHFHDTLGGTCLPSTYPQMDAQLGLSQTVADEVAAVALRSRMVKLPSSIHQRLVVANYSGADFSGWIEHEPWLEWTEWKPDWSLVDEKGRRVPHQLLPVEAVFGESPRLLFRLTARRGEYRVLRIVHGKAGSRQSEADARFTLRRTRAGGLTASGSRLRFAMPGLQLIPDQTDTWSHGVDRFAGAPVAAVKWGVPRLVEQGPLMWAWCVDGRIGSSRVQAEVRRYTGEQFLELRLRITWLERQRVLRLAWSQPAAILGREDGVSGGTLHRPTNGAELPVHDFSALRLADGGRSGVVLPDTFSISAEATELRLTLLRSAVMAHHVPHDGRKERRVISDQGIQSFVFRFYPKIGTGADLMRRHALEMHRRPFVADYTRGMPLRAMRGKVTPAALQ